MSSDKLGNADYSYVIDYYLNGALLKSAGSASEQVFKARMVGSNALLAEALVRTHESVAPLESVRTWISRSNFRSALDLIQRGLEETSEPRVRADYLLDQARICFFEGDWCTGVTLTTKALELDPVATTLMALIQVRSSCFFELGEWALSRKDSATLETLGHLYSKATVLFLSRMTQAKIAARVQSPKLAHLLRQQLWNDFLGAKMTANRDHFIGLCRLEIDLARVEGRSFQHWARIAYLICRDSGDRLYEDLALLDMACESDEPTKAILINELHQFADLQRIQIALKAADSKDTSGLGTTMTTVCRSMLQPVRTDGSLLLANTPSNFILSPDGNLLIVRDPFRVRRLDPTRRSDQLLLALSNGAIGKVELFERVYKQKYASYLHEKLLRNQISRARFELGIPIVSRNRVVEIPEGVLICV